MLAVIVTDFALSLGVLKTQGYLFNPIQRLQIGIHNSFPVIGSETLAIGQAVLDGETMVGGLKGQAPLQGNSKS